MSPDEPQPDRPAECPPCPPCPPAETGADLEASSKNTIWYAMSGVILGTGVSLILYLILQEPDSRR